MSIQNWFQDPPFPLLAVELQYFRVPRPQWERALLRMRQIGANAISTRVMWGWHEPVEGQLDFSGATAPECDLLGFIRLAQELGFVMLLKPGPFIDSETLGGGIPSWLLARLPVAHARRHDGGLWRHPASGQPRLSYLHPLAMEHTRGWLQAFSQAVVGLQWPQGPVIALQIDNETPGNGFIAGDQDAAGFDYHFRGDYNPYYTQELWPQWLANRYGNLENLSSAYASPISNLHSVPFPASWSEPRHLGDLRLYMDAARFTDWTFNQALREYAASLREFGWQVPFFQNLLCMPWEASGLLLNPGGLATAAGWSGQNVYPQAVRNAFVTGSVSQMGFEEYVQLAIWRARMLKNYSPGFPGFVSEASSDNDFLLQSLFSGSSEAAGINAALPSDPQPASVGSRPRWAEHAPLRLDGSLRRQAWNVKTLFDYLQAGGRAFTRSRLPADLVLGYTHTPELASQWFFNPDYFGSPGNRQIFAGRKGLNEQVSQVSAALRGSEVGARSQVLAQEMLRRQIDFDVLDLDFARPEQLDPTRLLVLPAMAIMARLTQLRLAEFLQKGGRIAWIGGELPELDENLAACDELRKAAQETRRVWMLPDLPGNWQEKLVQMGYLPRYAWSDATEGIDVHVRYGPEGVIFLSVANRLNQTFEGNIHYLDENRQIQSLKVRLSGPHVSFVALKSGQLQAAVLHGQDGAHIQCNLETYSIDYGQVVFARFGPTIMVSSADPVRMQCTSPTGWGNPGIWRMVLNGQALSFSTLPSAAQNSAGRNFSVKIDGELLLIDYPTDAAGLDSLMVLVHPARQPLPVDLRQLFDAGRLYFGQILQGAAEQCHRLLEKLTVESAAFKKLPEIRQLLETLNHSERQLQALVSGLQIDPGQPLLVESYAEQMDQVLEQSAKASKLLVDALRWQRAALAAGSLPADTAWIATALTAILQMLASPD